MTDPVKVMEDAPHLGMPEPDPQPVPGCPRCHYWAGQRSEARTVGDGARVSDCNVHLRRHPH